MSWRKIDVGLGEFIEVNARGQIKEIKRGMTMSNFLGSDGSYSVVLHRETGEWIRLGPDMPETFPPQPKSSAAAAPVAEAAAAEATAPPKMPHAIKKLHLEIMAHPDYKTKLPDTTRWAFESACVERGSHRDKENNAWSRSIWKFLYLGEPMDETSGELYF